MITVGKKERSAIEKLRYDVLELDSLMEMFQDTYLYFLDVGEEKPQDRARGTITFYMMKDLVEAMVNECEKI